MRSTPGERRPPLGCTSYDRCIALAKERLAAHDSGGAIAALEESVALAGGDLAGRAEAYGYLGSAYEASGEYVAALAYTERARATVPVRPAWIDANYKRLLSGHPTMTAAEIQQKLKLDQQIASNESHLQVAEAPVEDAAGADPGGSGYTVEMGPVRGIGLDVAMDEDNQKYAPKPKARPQAHAEPRAKAQPARTSAKQRAEPPPRPKKPESARTGQPSPRHRQMAMNSPREPVEHLPSLDLRINFDYNSAELTAEGTRQAEELGKALEALLAENPDAKFLLIGHTDTYGSELYNLSLSRDRAESVKAYLARHFSGLAEKLAMEGMGEQSPIFDEPDEATQKLNRRVEVKRLR